jgi:UDP-N-acetylglucosamine enolpyruvyl transferase
MIRARFSPKAAPTWTKFPTILQPTIPRRRSAIVKGVRPLSGAPGMASDLRLSAALVIAGLAAKGATQVNLIFYLDRAYEQMDAKLRKHGARIQRLEEK